jgi:tRNA(Arg) A34 adenosine deaminase TadA
MDRIWEVCADLCLEGINAGSLGIASVVADKTGTIITRGRNQLFDSADSCNTIRNSQVAHAEMNALAALKGEQREDRSATLYTTVEPCPMCMGAISMSRIRHVVVASRDLYAGATHLAQTDQYLSRKVFRIEFVDGPWETLFASLHVYSLILDTRVDNTCHPFFARFESRYEGLTRKMLALDEDPAFRAAVTSHDLATIRVMVGAQLPSSAISEPSTVDGSVGGEAGS